MKKALLIIPIVIALVLSGCAAKSTVSATPAFRQDLASGAPAMEAPKAVNALPGIVSNAGSGDTSATTPQSERIVVKNASITIIVQDPTVVVTVISKMAEGMGGFVVNSNLYQTNTVGDEKIYEGSVTIRVPVAQLDTAMSQIRSQVKDPKTDVLNENISGEDVTSTVVDLESRLHNYQATQTQLLIFMDKATKTEDALAVLNQLTAVQEQIEVLQGQIKYYRESAAMSAINVTVQPKIPVQPVTVAGWNPVKVLRNAAQTLVEILKGLFDVIIFVAVLLGPFALLFFFVYWLVWLGLKKKGWQRKGLKFYRPGAQFAPPAIPTPTLRSSKKKTQKTPGSLN